METLMILTYAAICYGVFKVFRIPLNKWTVPTAVLGGIVMLGTVLVLMNYNHPYTKVARTIVVTTPIIPAVRGLGIDVPVRPNILIKEGTVLFMIDPTPFQAAVDQSRAALAKARQDVKIRKENWNQAKAGVKRAVAERNRAKQNYDRYAQANKKSKRGTGPFSKAQVQNRRDKYLAVQAKLDAASAAERSAGLAYQSNIDGRNTDVARLQAALDSAVFEMDRTVVRAPTDGMVTQLLLRRGMMATPLPLRPTMVFVHDEQKVLVAAFRQNSLQRLKVGGEAEVIFPALPGRLFKGRIASILPVIAEGAVQATGNLISQNVAFAARPQVIIALDDDVSSYNLPAGVSAEVAIYTEHVHHVAMIRRVLLRMKSWQNYIFSEGH